MKAYDYEAVTYDGAVYCSGCLPKGISSESEDVSPIFANSEWDGYPVCDACGEKHEYVNLTCHGRLAECRNQNIEIFHMGTKDFATAQDSGTWMEDAMENNDVEWSDPESVKLESDSLAGFYYWTCFPGCLPEGDAIGPFKTEDEAARDALGI